MSEFWAVFYLQHFGEQWFNQSDFVWQGFQNPWGCHSVSITKTMSLKLSEYIALFCCVWVFFLQKCFFPSCHPPALLPCVYAHFYTRDQWRVFRFRPPAAIGAGQRKLCAFIILISVSLILIRNPICWDPCISWCCCLHLQGRKQRKGNVMVIFFGGT